MVWRKCLARRRPCGSRRAAGDGPRSGPGDPDPIDGFAARFAADRGAGRAARYGDRGERAFRSEQALPAMGRAAAPGDPDPNEIPRFAANSLKLWFGIPTKPAKGPPLTHRVAPFAAWRQLLRDFRGATNPGQFTA
jgi:hypothetical protein